MRFSYLGVVTIIGLLWLCSFSSLAPSWVASTAFAQTAEAQDRKAEANRFFEQGIQQFNHSQYQEALQSWQQALKIYQEIGDRNDEVRVLNNLGIIYNSLGQYLQGIDFSQQALVIFQDIGDRSGAAKALNSLGNAYGSLGQYSRAVEYYEQSRAIFQETDDHNGEANVLGNLGNVYNHLGQYPKAIEYYEQSLAIFQETSDRAGEASAMANLGIAYDSLGQYSKAIEYYDQALVIFQETGYLYGAANSFMNLGIVYKNLGQYSKAIEYYDQALAIFQETGYRNGEANVLGNLGEAYKNLEQYPKAIESYQQSLAIQQNIGDRNGEAASLMGLGNTYRSLGQYPKAIESYQQSLAIQQNIGDRNGEAASLTGLGNTYYNLEQYPKAIEFFEQSLAIFQNIDNRSGEAVAMNNLGNAFLQTHKPEKATTLLFNAAQALESLRTGLTDIDKVNLLETQSDTYQILQLALVSQNRIEEALVAAERGRSRAFVEQLAQRLGAQTTTELITQNIPTLDQLKQIAAQRNATLIEYSFVYDQQVRDPNRQLYIWVIRPTGEITFQKVDLSTLNTSLTDLVDASREAIGVTRSSFVSVVPRPGTEQQQTQNLKQLYQLLIEPIADQLPTDPNAPVIFIPQGELFSVPFAALKDESGNDLIDQHTIITSPSIQILDKTHQLITQVEQANLDDALVVGNPTMPRVSLAGESPQQLIPLVGAEQEAKTIASLLQTQPLIGSQAKKAAVVQRMQHSRMIHLATHGLLDDRQGLDSAIALTPDGTGEINDGLLTAAEIAQMKLNAELVVLSACDTAQGRITGDGVIGLSRSLITAGVPSVLVSLWSVPDTPTAELMTEFYQQLQQTGNKAQALRQAMLTTKAKHPNPRDWAAFTLVGEGE